MDFTWYFVIVPVTIVKVWNKSIFSDSFKSIGENKLGELCASECTISYGFKVGLGKIDAAQRGTVRKSVFADRINVAAQYYRFDRAVFKGFGTDRGDPFAFDGVGDNDLVALLLPAHDPDLGIRVCQSILKVVVFVDFRFCAGKLGDSLSRVNVGRVKQFARQYGQNTKDHHEHQHKGNCALDYILHIISFLCKKSEQSIFCIFIPHNNMLNSQLCQQYIMLFYVMHMKSRIQ